MNSLPNNGPLPNPNPGIRPTDAAGASKDNAKLAEGGPAFRALFEQLQQKAAALSESSKGVDDPADLRGAVDTARSTLEDALTLGDQILEAFRESRQLGETAPEESRSSERTPGPRTTD